MKPLYRKITQASESSFSFQFEQPPLFETPWHFHPEYELILIEGSHGKRFLGDSIDKFNNTELVLIGPNIPHFWQNDRTKTAADSKAYVIHFAGDFLGYKYFGLPELLPVKKLLERAQRGLKITGNTNKFVRSLIKSFPTAKKFERLITLQQILFHISQSKDLEMLASEGFVESFNTNPDDRMNKVYEYTLTNFKNKISLDKIASVACLSKIAFCRYFKKSTSKSYFTFLNEIRVGYSCKLLMEGNHSVSEICYESGFNSLSHFNSQFKLITKQQPKQYKEIYGGKK
jgi:AraC-like DNA-binding protein